MTNRPLASTLIAFPAPNIPNIPLTIQSALSQTGITSELIICINPSALIPDIREALKPLENAVRILTPKQNLRRGELLALGAEAAAGEYLTWCGSDEVADIRRMALQLETAKALPEAGAVSCHVREWGARIAPFAMPQPVIPALESSPAEVTISLLNGSRPATGLLVHRSCFEAVGGFDRSLDFTCELDLALRLAARFPFAHTGQNGLRRLGKRALPEDHARQELLALHRRVLESEVPSIHALSRLLHALGQNVSQLRSGILRHVLPLMDGLDVAFAIPVTRQSAEASEIAASLNLPDRAWFRLEARGIPPLRILRNALQQTAARWLVIADPFQSPDPFFVALQRVHAEEAALDACPPMTDTHTWQPFTSPSLIYGTLFRTEAIQAVDWDGIDSEAAFWRAVLAGGVSRNRIGGVSAHWMEAAVLQVELTLEDVGAALVDESWYLQNYQDVARAGAGATAHFVHYGWKEGRSPAGWLDTTLLAQFDAGSGHPLHGFLASGKIPRDVITRPGFDLRYYASQRLNGRACNVEEVLKTLLPGWQALAAKVQTDQFAAVLQQLEKTAPGLVLVARLLSPEIDTIGMVRHLVDSGWYREQYGWQQNPVEHYLHYGCREGFEPNAWFDSAWYWKQLPEAAVSAGQTAVEHYVREGASAGYQPHRGFHTDWYASRYLPEGSDTGAGALLHFIREGAANGNLPHPRLDRIPVHREIASSSSAARSANLHRFASFLPDEQATVAALIDQYWYRSLAAGVANPIDHYLQQGWKTNLDPNPWFDSAWYRSQLTEQEKELPPLVHFVRMGAMRGMRPSPPFDHVWYGERYLGACTPTADALLHFLATGILQGAVPHPDLHVPEYLAQNNRTPVHQRSWQMLGQMRRIQNREELTAALVDKEWYRQTYNVTEDSLLHYRKTGWRRGHNPNPWFHTAWYLRQNPNADTSDSSPLDHFVNAGAREGRDPHPLFRTRWYARFYLGSTENSAEALLHFMKTGFDNGHVPDPRLATPNVKKRLSALSAGSRAELLPKLLEMLSRAQLGAVRWKAADADVWPVLLTREFPEFTTGTLLLMDPDNPDALAAAQGAATALPFEEAPLFGVMDRENRLRLMAELDPDSPAVILTLPDETDGLKKLLREIPCRRAAAVTPGLLNTTIARAVRNADVPVSGRS